tara:strand:+ start:596 stop:1075 length:480 start_codon:yes stop_codon:yes gene_type:complete
MILIKYLVIVIFVFVFQLWASEFFSLGTIDPDFCVIIILYISIKEGRLVGTLTGFFIGLLIDLSSGSNQFFGLTPLIYTTTGYLSGFLNNQNDKLNKIYFTFLWVAIILCQFLVFSLVFYQGYLVQDPIYFMVKWLGTSLYTLTFLGILQFIIPIYRLS